MTDLKTIANRDLARRRRESKARKKAERVRRSSEIEEFRTAAKAVLEEKLGLDEGALQKVTSTVETAHEPWRLMISVDGFTFLVEKRRKQNAWNIWLRDLDRPDGKGKFIRRAADLVD